MLSAGFSWRAVSTIASNIAIFIFYFSYFAILAKVDWLCTATVSLYTDQTLFL